MNSDPHESQQDDLFAAAESANHSNADKIKTFLRSRREPSFSLSLELATALFAVLIVVFIAIYYLGFLKGQRVAKHEVEQLIYQYKQQNSRPTKKVTDVIVESVKPSVSINKNIEKSSSPESIAKQGRKPYTIQAVAYRHRGQADKEVARLESRGYTSQVIEEGAFYVVCVGRYSGRSEAHQDLQALKRFYSDGYLRKF